MARQTLPQPENPEEAITHKACPDCYSEGRDPYILPVDKFYVRQARGSRYKGGLRVSAYCIEHEKKRELARQQARRERERETGVADPMLERRRAQQREAARERRRAKPEANKAARQRYRLTHKDRVAAQYAAWVAAHPEQRRQTQNDWYAANRDQVLARQRKKRQEGHRSTMQQVAKRHRGVYTNEPTGG